MRSLGRAAEERRRTRLATDLRDALASRDGEEVARLLGPRARVTVGVGRGGQTVPDAEVCGSDVRGSELRGSGLRWEVTSYNGAPAVVLRREGAPLVVIILTGRRGRVRELWVLPQADCACQAVCASSS